MLRLAGALSATILPLLPSIAYAHVGHLGALAGHTRWAGAAAVAGAALVGGIVALRERRNKAASEKTGVKAATDGEAAR